MRKMNIIAAKSHRNRQRPRACMITKSISLITNNRP